MKYQIATLGSHSALQIMKGAFDEGFATLLIATPERTAFYERFPFIKEIVTIPTLSSVAAIEQKLSSRPVILIPHGSFVQYLGVSGNKQITVPYFGNKAVLDYEADRNKQRLWLEKSALPLPRQSTVIEGMKFPVIVKTQGAAGGAGYFFASSVKDFNTKVKKLIKKSYVIQEYIVGVTAYFQYFYSPLSKQLELMGIDRRYESNVDGLGRITVSDQMQFSPEPEFVVVGNSPLVVRESLLPEIYAMGERVVAASRKLIASKGLFGPFCLETIITPDQKIYCIEISCRIVAGSNLFIDGSPYSQLLYKEPMSTGRRIAREIKNAIKQNKLSIVIN
ncbi:DUF1297 domain-containing protein [Candidatus Microgenomates bacterium]|nr:MAG: DUF1297 domain-containing protein [Candidatus Microgenomates bacterium]